VQLVHTQGVVVDTITFQNSPDWTFHLLNWCGPEAVSTPSTPPPPTHHPDGGPPPPPIARLTSLSPTHPHTLTHADPSPNAHIGAPCSTDVMVVRLTQYGDPRWPNNDGIDIDSSTRVSVLDSSFNTGDDGR
jgi:hypothetical protein